MSIVHRILELLIVLLIGFACGLIFWADQTPDQPKESSCVPIYYSGLECCQPIG